MRVISLADCGDPSVLQVAELPIPEPSPGEFRVRVHACAVCGHDVLARAGKLRAQTGDVLGHEISGEVDQVGDPQLEHWLGKRVALTQRRVCGMCDDCLKGATNQCRVGPGFYGDDIQGGYAEYVLADPRNTVEIPAEMSFADAAVLNCGIGTGYRAIMASGCEAGEVMLITGASGGVGLNAVALAKALGIRIVALVSRPTKVAAVEAAGADVVLVNATAKDVKQSAMQLGASRGVDAALELTGSPTFNVSLSSLAPLGQLVIVGNVNPSKLIDLPVGLIILKELRVQGSAHATRKDLEDVMQFVTTGAFEMPPIQVFPFSEVATVHELLERREMIGRAVLQADVNKN